MIIVAFHRLCTNLHIEQFRTQNRFTSIELIALMECALHTNTLYTIQRGQTILGDPYFYKRKIRITAILQQNSCSSKFRLRVK